MTAYIDYLKTHIIGQKNLAKTTYNLGRGRGKKRDLGLIVHVNHGILKFKRTRVGLQNINEWHGIS